MNSTFWVQNKKTPDFTFCVFSGPGCKEQLAHGCYATARNQWVSNRDLGIMNRAHYPLGYCVTQWYLQWWLGLTLSNCEKAGPLNNNWRWYNSANSSIAASCLLLTMTASSSLRACCSSCLMILCSSAWAFRRFCSSANCSTISSRRSSTSSIHQKQPTRVRTIPSKAPNIQYPIILATSDTNTQYQYRH